MKKVVTALGAGLLSLGLSAGVGLWNAPTSGATAAVPTLTVNGKPSTGPAGPANLSLTKTNTLKIAGAGWDPNTAKKAVGDTILAFLCNADASGTSPTVQGLSGLTSGEDNCSQPVTVTAKASTGSFSISLKVLAGRQGVNSNSPSCPGGQVDAQEGVNCLVVVADASQAEACISAPSTCPTPIVLDEAVFFAAPALTTSDLYQSGSGGSASYNVTVSDSGDYTESGYPPVSTTDSYSNASIVPNWGGFATSGILCSNGSASGCIPEGTTVDGTFVPTSCQAGSAPGGTAWATDPVCTYGAAAGEPIEVEVTLWTTYPTTATGGESNPLPTDVPLDCTTSGCTASANAGYGVANAGGFSYTLDGATAGKYHFEAIGSVSGTLAKGIVSLLPGPTSGTSA